MQRITIKNIEDLAVIISRYTGKQYQVGQLYGARWMLATVDGHTLLSQPTKTELYNHMHSLLAGVRQVAPLVGSLSSYVGVGISEGAYKHTMPTIGRGLSCV